jgi:hypothetical protein
MRLFHWLKGGRDALATSGITPELQKSLGLDLRCFANVCGLRTFLTLSNFELHLIALLKTFVAFRGNRTVVDKDIGAIVPSDEAVALSIVKPFHRTF